MIEDFSGDFRVMRIVMASSNPIETLHDLRNGKYSVITFFKMLEMMDANSTIQEDVEYREKIKRDMAQRKS